MNASALYASNPGSFGYSGLSASNSFALKFDGSQNYLNLGTLGTFGSNLGSGLYLSFTLQTSSVATSIGLMGEIKAGNTDTIRLILNLGGVPGQLSLSFYDHTGNQIVGNITAPALVDGTPHAVTITATTTTIAMTVDGVDQTVNYTNQQTLSSFVNIPLNFIVGGFNNNGTPQNFAAITIDKIQIGTSSSNLFASYNMLEGAGTTTADSSGKGNTGTLTGSPLPLWVTAI